MNTFKQFLYNEGYSNSTIQGYTKEANTFEVWCKKNNTSPETIDYKTVLLYIKQLQSKNLATKTVNHKIGTLKVYFKYLLFEELRGDNPIEHLNIRGTKRTLNHNLLSEEELENLYYSYQTEDIKPHYSKLIARKNKVMVGFMVYQGLNTTDLRLLEVDDVQLYKGKVSIKSTKRSNARILELKPWQIVELLEYINEIRNEIAKANSIDSDRLFIPNNARLDRVVSSINSKLKNYNTRVVNLNQIRASVITLWLKQYNLRVVQYMAGHRFISSTEKYLQENLDSLQELINTKHPFK